MELFKKEQSSPSMTKASTAKCHSCVSQRYSIAFLSFLGVLVCIGFRTSFALVVTHIATFNSTLNGNSHNATPPESLFPDCTIFNTSRDRQVDWSGSTTSLFHAAFFIGQFVASIPAAMLASRFAPKWLFGITVMTSSVLFLILPKASEKSEISVYIIRTLQGIAEAVAVPSMNAVISSVAPKEERARLINIVYAGVYLSPAVAMFTTGATTCYVSWNSIIYIYGTLGVVWSIMWLWLVDKANDGIQEIDRLDERSHLLLNTTYRADKANHSLTSLPWCEIFTSLPVISIWVGSFCRNAIFALLITEIQQYYKDVYDLSTATIGLFSAVPFLSMPLLMILISYCFDSLAKKKYLSVTHVRKLAQFTGDSVLGGCFLAMGFIKSHNAAFILICIGMAFSAFPMSGFQTNPLDLAPRYVGALSGIIRTGMIGSVFITVLASQLPGKSHSLSDWQHLFIIAGSVNLGGMLFYLIFASGNQQPWATTTTATTPTTATTATTATTKDKERNRRVD